MGERGLAAVADQLFTGLQADLCAGNRPCLLLLLAPTSLLTVGFAVCPPSQLLILLDASSGPGLQTGQSAAAAILAQLAPLEMRHGLAAIAVGAFSTSFAQTTHQSPAG